MTGERGGCIWDVPEDVLAVALAAAAAVVSAAVWGVLAVSVAQGAAAAVGVDLADAECPVVVSADLAEWAVSPQEASVPAPLLSTMHPVNTIQVPAQVAAVPALTLAEINAAARGLA